MPANAIRRSDEQIIEKYDKFAEKLEKFQENADAPKFYEYGKSVAYQGDDVSCLPTFTTNMITLSNLDEIDGYNEAVPQEVNKVKTARSIKRRIVAQLVLLDDETNGDICPKCQSDNTDLDIAAFKETSDGMFPYVCNDCGNKWESPEEDFMQEMREQMLERELKDDYPFPYGDEDEPVGKPVDIIASIESLLPQITAKSNQKMNKMAGNIVSGLIGSLEIDDSNKKWLNAQIENGILDTNVFMRNIKTSMSMNKEANYLDERHRGDRLKANQMREQDPRYTLGDRIVNSLNPYEYAERTKQEIAGEDVEQFNTTKRRHLDKQRANQIRKQDPRYTVGDRLLRLFNPYEYTRRTQQEIGIDGSLTPKKLKPVNSDQLMGTFNSDPERLQQTVQKLQNTPAGGA